YGQWVFHLARAEPLLAISFAEQMENLGEAQNDLASLLLARAIHGIACSYLGKFVPARAIFEQCDGLIRPANRSVYAAVTAEDPHIVTLAHLALALTCLGYLNQGRAVMSDALLQARTLDHPCTLTLVLNNACFTLRWFNSPLPASLYAQ